MNQQKYLITGASGFIGGSLFDLLNQQNILTVGLGRRFKNVKNYFQCDIFDNKKLEDLLKGSTCVVHCAGYAHAFHSSSKQAKDATWKINYEGARNVMQLAAQAGVSKFIHLSSVKAMGDPGKLCVDEGWLSPPESEYGKSKLAAEKMISDLGRQFGVQVVNLRLSMVYGSGGGGNLERMARLVSKNLFPPLPETHNHRSMVHIEDVMQAILCVANDKNLIDEVFIVAGRDAPSGRELYDQLRAVLGMGPLYIQIPRPFLEWLALACEIFQRILKKKLPFNREVLNRLLNSEWYSSKKLESTVNWVPKVSLVDGLAQMVNQILPIKLK